MIAFLRGVLLQKSPTEIVVDVQGVGYGLSIPLSTFEKLGDIDSPVSLFTHLHVREDMLHLYGFATEEERNVFRLLIGVNGIGPRMAQGILSGIPTTDLRSHISRSNITALTTIPGVGKKLAERLVIELRDKITKIESGVLVDGIPARSISAATNEALLALTSLGYNRTVAEKAIRSALTEFNGNDAPVEALIKSALRNISK